MNAPPLLPRALLERRAAAWCLDFAVLAPLSWLLARLFAPSDLDAVGSAMQQMRAVFQRTLVDAANDGADITSLYAQLLGQGPLRDATNAVASSLTGLLLHVALAYALLALPWHLGGELSLLRGSLGKKLLGLRVTSGNGKPVGAGQLVLRHCAALLSWLTLNLGHLMALRPPFRALHDHVADTQVMALKGTPPLPSWGRGLLRAAALATILIPLWIAWELAQWLAAA